MAINLHHFFLPHHKTKKKAHLLSPKALLVYLLLLGSVYFGSKAVTNVFPGIFGVRSTITTQGIILQTNEQRKKLGLLQLRENTRLDQAAKNKAKDMFMQQYWAHIAPSGKTPWDFIRASQYHYTSAGENLAEGYSTTNDVMSAWLKSPTHRENLFKSEYRDIGVAVIAGVLHGETTTLVVQMFGSETDEFATSKTSITKDIVAATTEAQIVNTTDLSHKDTRRVVISETQITKIFGFVLIIFLSVLIIIDILMLRRKVKHHKRHGVYVLLLIVGGLLIFLLSTGRIL